MNDADVEIANCAADLDVLFPLLRGTHHASRGGIVASYAAGLILTVGGLAAGRITIAASDSGGLVPGIFITALLFGFAAAAVSESHVTYTIDDETITRRHPISRFSWSVRRFEIHDVAVSITGYGFFLVVTNVEWTRRRIPLDGTLRTAIATLYPAFGRDVPTPADRRRRTWLSIILLILILGTAALLWWVAE